MLLPRLKVGDCSHSDNAEALCSFIVNDMPDPVRLFEIVGGLIPKSRQGGNPRAETPRCSSRTMRTTLVGGR
jgi:hypothetical protein